MGNPLVEILKRTLPHTLFGRSLLILLLPLVLLQLVTTYIFFDRHHEAVTRRQAAAIAGDIAFIIDSLETAEGETAFARLSDMALRHLEMRIMLVSGTILPNQPSEIDSVIEPPLVRALEERVQRPFRLQASARDRDIEIKVQLARGVLEVQTSRKRLFSPTTYVLIMWMVGTSLVLFAVAVIFLRNQIRPIRRLAAAADAFGKGRDAAGFRPEGATEVRQAAQAFLVMRERIQRQIDQRTEMLAGVSHDLRTPLTRMKLELAMLGNSPEIQALRGDVSDMERMVEGYLAFARGEGTEPPQPTDVGRLLEDLVNPAKRAGHLIELSLSPDMRASATVELRPVAIKRGIGNLIDNACRHADRVHVSARRIDHAIEITVDDDGPGIPETLLETVFKPFVRLDPSRNPATGGTGLGLTIARDIMRGHGGDVTLERSAMGGARARAVLPV
jgi:two-component system osmolarity sensor histidine kinase EnvZ